MHSMLKTGTAALFAAFALGASAGAVQAATLKITVTNLGVSGGLTITPVFAAFHNGSFDTFNVGDAASAGLEEIAETGSAAFEVYQYLGSGLKLVIVGLGIFAIPEIVALLRQDRSISDRSPLGGGWMTGVSDWFANIWLSVRCSVIGVIVGVIPGLGGSVVDWIAYGHTVQTTPDKSKFGAPSTTNTTGIIKTNVPISIPKAFIKGGCAESAVRPQTPANA